MTVNCAAIPETLLESVLFGHVKGAFTGATFDKIGEFQKADGGTLFLDELGELPLMLQAKVLRAIEQGEVTPLGSNAAPGGSTCAHLRDQPRPARRWCSEGRFRDDLYYRVGVITIELPPLRTLQGQPRDPRAGVPAAGGAEARPRKVLAISPRGDGAAAAPTTSPATCAS